MNASIATNRRDHIRRGACLATLLWTAPPGVWAAITCTAVTASAVTSPTPSTGNLDVIGALSLTCTRLTTDLTTGTIYIGMNNGLNVTGTTRRAKRTTPVSNHFINHYLSRNALPANQNIPTGLWTTAAGRAPGNTGTGGLNFPLTFTSAVTITQNFSVPFYYRMRDTNYNAAATPAGVFTDTITVELRNTATDPVLASGTLGVQITKAATCVFQTSPAAVSVPYTAFATANVVRTTAFAARCTNLTPYTLAITPTAAVLVGVRYTAALSRASANGTGNNQTTTVTITAAANQAGSCPTNSCSGTQAHTVQITY